MNSFLITGAIAAVFALGAAASEKKVDFKDLPSPVQAAVKEQTRNATLVSITSEVEKGKTTYEVETKVNGKSRDVTLDPSGTLLSVEEETTLDQIPAAAKAAIEKQAAGGKVFKVETVTQGKTVTYEAHIEKQGKKKEFTVNAEGKQVKD